MKNPKQVKRIFAIVLVLIGLILLVQSVDMGIYTLPYSDIRQKAASTAQKTGIVLKGSAIAGNLLYFTAIDTTDKTKQYIFGFRKSSLIDLYQQLPTRTLTSQPTGPSETTLMDQNTTYTFVINGTGDIVIKSRLGRIWDSNGFEPLFLYMLVMLVIYPLVFKKKKPSTV